MSSPSPINQHPRLKPEDAVAIDVDADGDGGVVAWIENKNTAMKVSTQKKE